MSRSRRSTFLAVKLVALAAICSVGLIALPAVASAATPLCRVLDGAGVPLADNAMTVAPSSTTSLTLDCMSGGSMDNYDISNTSSAGWFADGVFSQANTETQDPPNNGDQMTGIYHASAAYGAEGFSFVGNDAQGNSSASVFVAVQVAAPAPVCTITSGDGQSVAKSTAAAPVAFTCSDNGDGPVTVGVAGGTLGTATLDTNGSSVDYTGDTQSGTDTGVRLFASTAHSLASTLTFTYVVTDAAPVCNTLNLEVQGGQDEQLLVDYAHEAACSDANGDTLSYTVSDSSGASGTLDDGNVGIYDEAATHFEDTTPFTDTFQVDATDGTNTTAFTVNILVKPNHPPTCTVDAGDDHQSVTHNGASITIGIHCSDQDISFLPQNDEFGVWFDENALSSQGRAQLNDNSDTITYTPNWNGLGPDTVALLVTQNTDGAQQSTLLVHVNVTDQAPACADASLAMTSDSFAGADLACTDANGDYVGYSVDRAPQNGTIYQSGSIFSYIPNAGFVGTDTFTVLADDGAMQTPITITAHVAAATPAGVPVVTPPTIVPPVVLVTPPAPKLSSPVTVKDGKVSLELGCTNQTASCKARVALTMLLGGKTVSLGTKAITIKSGKHGAITISLSGNARKALKPFAGKTITVKVAVKTTNPKTGEKVIVTTALKVKVPR
jgi:hypothetical protein